MNLVHEYVSCMDEMSHIHEISMQKIEFLEELREHCNAIHISATEQIDEAVRQIKKDNKNLPRLCNDLKASLGVVDISTPDAQPVS